MGEDTTVRVPLETYEKLRKLKFNLRKSMKKIVEEAINAYDSEKEESDGD